MICLQNCDTHAKKLFLSVRSLMQAHWAQHFHPAGKEMLRSLGSSTAGYGKTRATPENWSAQSARSRGCQSCKTAPQTAAAVIARRQAPLPGRATMTSAHNRLMHPMTLLDHLDWSVTEPPARANLAGATLLQQVGRLACSLAYRPQQQLSMSLTAGSCMSHHISCYNVL